MRTRTYTPLTILCLALCQCAGLDENIADSSLEDLYSKAIDHYQKNNYEKAIDFFQAVERQYPYDKWSIQAQMMVGYLQYLIRDFDAAISSFKLFIDLHPFHEHVPYAYYMLGMCHYQQLSIIQRDQKAAQEGLAMFELVMDKYPTSKFAKDAKVKVAHLKDHLAGKRIDIARFYQSNRSYDAAVGRLIDAISEYPDSVHIPEAKWRLVESYDKLGLRSEAIKAANDLIKNHPQTVWAGYAKDYKKPTK